MSFYHLVVFDLDKTLWPFRVDDCKPPFKVENGLDVMDSSGKILSLYAETVSVLKLLSTKGYKLAIASRIENICGALELLELFDINQYFEYKEIYPLSKVNHFKIISGLSKICYEKMIFFDDDKRNLRSVALLGVTTSQVIGGVTMEFVKLCLSGQFDGTSY